MMRKFMMMFIVCLSLPHGLYSGVENDKQRVEQEQVREKSNTAKLFGAFAKTVHDHPIMVAWMMFDYYEHRKEDNFPGFFSILFGALMSADLAHNMLHECNVAHDCQR